MILPFSVKKINKVTLPDQVETVGAGAFMGTGLQEFGWNLNDINKAGLRIIEEYAFKDNELSSVKFPELMHAVRTVRLKIIRSKLWNLENTLDISVTAHSRTTS